jgi:CTP synthase
VEIPDHPFFIASQFHPEFKSRPNHPHPLFEGFMKAALEHKRGGDRSTIVLNETAAEVPAERPS